MEIDGLNNRIERITAVRANRCSDAELIRSGLIAVRELQAWCDAQHAGLVAQLKLVDSFPERTVADAAKGSLGQATKVTERSATLDSTTQLAAALADGMITAGHIDAVTRASKKLEPAKRAALLHRADALVDVATAGSVDDFARRLDLETRRLDDCDMNRLERQRRNTRARSWVDIEGMYNLSLKCDPVTGVKIAARIDTAVQTLFRERTPEHCPSDPIEKQRFLAAHAVADLLLGNARSIDTPTATPTRQPCSGRPEFLVVIDADAPCSAGPVAEFTIPVEIPARVLADLASNADITTVVVRNGIVLHAPGELQLGRSTRLANRAQRRALRGLYQGCAIPGCKVAFDRCNIHHIIWWRNGGTTDIDNLIPICHHHHAKIHNDDWHIELGPHREITLRLPDGTLHITGPPSRLAAA